MKILIDTCIWSLSLRRKKELDNSHVGELKELINEVRVAIIGSIRQEILSGISSQKHFNNLRNHLSSFPDLKMEQLDFECAAEMFNLCRSKGIQGSNTDFLMCAVSERLKIPIFTIDKDFVLFQKYVNIQLHIPRSN